MKSMRRLAAVLILPYLVLNAYNLHDVSWSAEAVALVLGGVVLVPALILFLLVWPRLVGKRRADALPAELVITSLATLAWMVFVTWMTMERPDCCDKCQDGDMMMGILFALTPLFGGGLALVYGVSQTIVMLVECMRQKKSRS